jgi:hypothetical protein
MGTEATMADGRINAFLKLFSTEIEEENAAIFAGAGLSRPAGFVDWRMLLKSIAEDLQLDISREENLVAIAQYYCNDRLGNRADINRLLLEEFAKDADVTENHRILARLPISTYWTTNYDKLIERALEEAGKRPDVKYSIEQLAFTKPHRDAVVYKMHGDIDHPSDAVLIKDDYERYHVRRQPFITALTGDLVSKTFLFIGFSFTDPNIDYILSRIRVTYADNMRTHYCFMKRLDEKDYTDKQTLEYKTRQQALFIGDLKRFNIYTVFLDSYAQVTDVLKQLERIYRTKSVFISGAAYDWGEFGRDRTRAFVRGLAKTLVDKDYRLVSGFGTGVGSLVISGALEHVYATKRGKMQDQLVLRPFPQDVVGDWPALLKRYRDDMTNYAGAAVFLFGNKQQDGQIALSDGVRQEFEIAKEKGLALIPVGATGFVARELWEKMMADLATYYPQRTDAFRAQFEVLGKADAAPEALTDAVVQILDLWSQS